MTISELVPIKGFFKLCLAKNILENLFCKYGKLLGQLIENTTSFTFFSITYRHTKTAKPRSCHPKNFGNTIYFVQGMKRFIDTKNENNVTDN